MAADPGLVRTQNPECKPVEVVPVWRSEGVRIVTWWVGWRDGHSGSSS